MEEESKMSFWKKLKTSIFGLEEYQKLALQKTSKTILYLIVLMLIFAFLLTGAITIRFNQVIENVKQYIESNIETIEFKDGKLSVKEKSNNAISIEEDKLLNAKIIINTDDIQEEQIDKYKEEIKGYYNGIVILQNKIILKTNMSNIPSTISLTDLANQFGIEKVEKEDIWQLLSSTELYITFFISIFAYMFIIYTATVLIDAILYSMIGYIAGVFSHLKIRYKNVYNIAIYALTLPIILNLIYMIINILIGYTIKYFSIMYMAITCIYIVTAILMIRMDLIKKQIELSKVIQEQEKVRAEMERKEQEKREEEEKEKVRKKDEKKEKEEKKKEGKKKTPKSEGPEPEANISNS